MNAIWDSFKSNLGNEAVPLNKQWLDKYLGDLFSVGKFYFYTVDFSTFPDLQCPYVDPSALEYYGVAPDAFSFNLVLSSVHPGDMPFCQACEEVIMNFFQKLDKGELLHYKSSYTLRMKHKTGSYRYIQHQAMTLSVDSNGGMTHVINVHTDISHIKQESGGTMSLIGLNGRKSFIGIDPFNPDFSKTNPLSNREREILEYLARGFEAKDIGNILNLSYHTVRTHRRNMLKKLNASSTIEMIHKAKSNLFF